MRVHHLARLLPAALLLAGGCAALRLPAADDPDRTRHAYEIVGEVRRADTLAGLPGAELSVDGAGAVDGDPRSDATGRFWLRVSAITPPKGPAQAAGPAGSVLVSARGAGLCATARVTLPAPGPVTLVAQPCPKE